MRKGFSFHIKKVLSGPHCKYTPQSILKSDRVLLRDHAICTGHSVDHYRPDLVLLLKEERASFIIDELLLNRKYSEVATKIPGLWPFGRKYETGKNITEDLSSCRKIFIKRRRCSI